MNGKQAAARRVAQWLILVVALVVTVGAAMPATAGACSLDGIASISIDGITAVRTTDAPSATTLALALAFLTKVLAYGGWLLFIVLPLAWLRGRRQRLRLQRKVGARPDL